MLESMRDVRSLQQKLAVSLQRDKEKEESRLATKKIEEEESAEKGLEK